MTERSNRTATWDIAKDRAGLPGCVVRCFEIERLVVNGDVLSEMI